MGKPWAFTLLPTTDNNSSAPPPPPTTDHQPLISSAVKTPLSTEIDQPQISFAPDQSRTLKDSYFLLIFCLLNLSTFAFGIFAGFHRNPNSGNLSSFTYDSTSTSCVGPTIYNSSPSNPLSLSIKFGSSSQSPTSSSTNVLLISLYTLVITLFLSIPISLCLLSSLRHYTKQLVYACLPFFLILPILGTVSWFLACTFSSSCSVNYPLANRIVVLIVGILIFGLIVWLLVANWHRVEFTIKIIEIASHALWRNLGLFVVLPALNLALLAYYVPIGVFLMFATSNGEIVPVDNMDGEFVCGWKQDIWVPLFCGLASLTMLWSATSMSQAQAYVISGTVARWYFAKDGSVLKRSIRNSLRNAFGPSSGTVCLSGLVVCVVRIVRSAVDKATGEEGASGILSLILQCFVTVLLRVVEFLNKFTINFAAITGEAYYTSAKMTYELLRRNLLSAVIVEAVSTRILGGIIFILSVIYAILVWAILYLSFDIREYTFIIAAMAWMLLLVVLGYLVHVLNSVTDTVYICYAIDKDKGEVYKQDVHDVYGHLLNNKRLSLVAGAPLSV